MADVPISRRGGGLGTQAVFPRPGPPRAAAPLAPIPSFVDLVELWHAQLYCCAACLAGSLVEAGPLTEKAFRRWHQGETGGIPLRAQRRRLFGALYREFAGPAPEREKDESPGFAASGACGLAAAALARVRRLKPGQLIAALGQVDGRCRAPLAFSYAGGCSAAEIAELMNLPARSVLLRLADGKVQLARALVALAPACASRPPTAAGPDSSRAGRGAPAPL